MANNPAVLLALSGQKSRDIDKVQQGNVKGIAGPDEPGAFVR